MSLFRDAHSRGIDTATSACKRIHTHIHTYIRCFALVRACLSVPARERDTRQVGLVRVWVWEERSRRVEDSTWSCGRDAHDVDERGTREARSAAETRRESRCRCCDGGCAGGGNCDSAGGRAVLARAGVRREMVCSAAKRYWLVCVIVGAAGGGECVRDRRHRGDRG